MLRGTALLPPIAADMRIDHDPPQPCIEVRSWLECPEAGISVEHGFLHQILRIHTIGCHPKSLPIERLKERDDGAFKLSARRAVWHLCTFRAHATHAISLLCLPFWCQHPPPRGEWSSPAEAIHPDESPRHPLDQLGRQRCGSCFSGALAASLRLRTLRDQPGRRGRGDSPAPLCAVPSITKTLRCRRTYHRALNADAPI